MGEPFRGSRRTESGLAYRATARTDGEESRLVGYQAESTLPKRLMSRCDAPDMNAALHNVNVCVGLVGQGETEAIDVRLLCPVGEPQRR
jgi:hypothetical protein